LKAKKRGCNEGPAQPQMDADEHREDYYEDAPCPPLR